MHGLMMDKELMISDLIEFAGTYHADREMFSRQTDGSDFIYTWKDCRDRARKLANALVKAGVKKGDKVGTIAWNNHRHMELYYAVSGIGAVIHTINPRIGPEQIAWMVNHAEDSMIFFDTTFAPIAAGIAAHCPNVKKWVCMSPADQVPDLPIDVDDYESFIESHSPEFDWPTFDEKTASALCYTSGTTGNPKGVLYSHRSTILHAFAACSHDVLQVGNDAVILAVVPMFHVNAWGLPYAAAMTGAKLVHPGPNLDGASLVQMINDQQVTNMLGVPTVWLGVLNHLKETGTKIPSVKRIGFGGSALPPALLRAYEKDYGILVQQGWGMTEMSPLGTFGGLLHKHKDLSWDDQAKIKLKAGRGIFGVDMRIMTEEGVPAPFDGETTGELEVRGPWIASGYYKGDGADAFTDDGWFKTGDVAHIDSDGYMTITDRAKDVIKSGGEWISSIDVDNAATDHPEVVMAATIGIPHEKWQERPLLIIQPVPGKNPNKDEIIACVTAKCPKWWTPDAVEFVDEMPIGATGKILKKELRKKFDGYKLG